MPFLICSLLLRVITAMGESVIYPASFALAANLLGEQNKAKALAIAESSFGIGLMFGPPLGGVLYSLGAFYAPFWFCGAFLFIIACLNIILYGEHEQKIEFEINVGEIEPLKWSAVLRINLIWKSLVALSLTSCSWYWYSASLQPFLSDKYGFSASQTGLVFMAGASAYTVTTPLFGILMDKGVSEAHMIILGNVLIVIGYVFLGPVPIFSFIKPSYWFTVISLVLQGVGSSAAFLGSFCYMLKGLEMAGIPDTDQSQGMVSSLYIIGDCLGAFIGAGVGGLAYQLIGFQNASYLPLGVISLVTVWFIIFSRNN